MDILVIRDGKEETRTYEVVKSNLMLRSYYRSIVRSASTHIGVTADELSIDNMIEYVCSSKDLINETMSKFYTGDHIDWADESVVDPELVEVALTNFFVNFYKASQEKAKKSKTSSQSTATSSSKTKPKARKKRTRSKRT